MLMGLGPLFIHSSFASPGIDTSSPKKVYVFELNQEIFPAAWRLVRTAMAEADSQHADVVLIKLNTYGGDLASADSIHSRLLHARPTVIAWITQNALGRRAHCHFLR